MAEQICPHGENITANLRQKEIDDRNCHKFKDGGGNFFYEYYCHCCYGSVGSFRAFELKNEKPKEYCDRCRPSGETLLHNFLRRMFGI